MRESRRESKNRSTSQFEQFRHDCAMTSVVISSMIVNIDAIFISLLCGLIAVI